MCRGRPLAVLLAMPTRHGTIARSGTAQELLFRRWIRRWGREHLVEDRKSTPIGGEFDNLLAETRIASQILLEVLVRLWIGICDVVEKDIVKIVRTLEAVHSCSFPPPNQVRFRTYATSDDLRLLARNPTPRCWYNFPNQRLTADKSRVPGAAARRV